MIEKSKQKKLNECKQEQHQATNEKKLRPEIP